MGRKPKLIETEFTDNDETPRVESLNLDEIFEDCGGDTGAQITGRVYRVNSPKDSLGRPTYEAIAKINKVVDEDWLGRNFGGGQYHIKYKVVRDGMKGEKQLNYNVGPEYNKYLNTDESTAAPDKTPAVAHVAGLDLGGLLGSLTVDKVAAIGGAIKIIKEIFAPPPPAPDIKSILEIMAATQQRATPSDAIVTACLNNLQKPPQPAQSIAQQIADFNALKELFKDNSNDSEEGGEMNFLLEKAFEYLPLLLQKKNNDYRAVGQEARQNPMVQGLILNNPDLAQKFFERARDTYGDENAKSLAAGFGLKMDIKQTPGEVINNEQN